jgi:hypothetical protein
MPLLPIYNLLKIEQTLYFVETTDTHDCAPRRVGKLQRFCIGAIHATNRVVYSCGDICLNNCFHL